MVDIFDESVFAFILELKPRKFHYHEESNTLVTWYWYICMVALLLHAQYGCGVLFICGKCYPRASVQINELTPHFLFTTTSLGVKEEKTTILTMKKILLLFWGILTLTTIHAQKKEYNMEQAVILYVENGVLLTIEEEGKRLYLDPETGSHISKKDFIQKYGRPTVQEIDNIEANRLKAEAEESEKIEKERNKALALERILSLNSFESVSYNKNEYDDILDQLDGLHDGIVDHLDAAMFFKENIVDLDKNGNISKVDIINSEGLSKEQIYTQVNSWFVHTFNSGKSVIQLNDKESGTLLAKGHLDNVSEQVGFFANYQMSAWILFRIDIKEGKTRLITTIQEYEFVDNGGIVGAISGKTDPIFNTCRPEASFPFIEENGTLSKKAGAKMFCACCMYMIATKNKLEKAINSGLTDYDLENW